MSPAWGRDFRPLNATNRVFPYRRKDIIDPMRVTPILHIAVIAAAVLTLPTAARGASAKDVFTKVAPSVVVVLALDEGGKTMGQGSGVVVGEYEVVTNCHVLGKAADVAVRQAADWSVRETYRMAASLLARNDERDLCLLFVDELPAPPAAQAVRLGAAKALSVGEEVYAVGAPAGLELSLSRGIVSQLRGAFGKRSAPLVQTDAAISPGSSGGGLFNQAGELVGITTFKWRGESLNFALPAEWIEELRAQGRSKLMEAKWRVECPKNPTYECVMDLALRTANSINDHHVLAAFLFRGIGSVQAEAGDGSAAWQSFAVAIKASSGIDDTMLRVSALRTIAIAQAEAGDIAGGLRTAHGIHDAEERVWALYEIVRVQAKAGDLQAARRTVDSALALEKGHDKYVMGRGYNLQEIAIIQAEAGDIAAALSTARNLYDVGFMHRRTETLRQLVTEHAKKMISPLSLRLPRTLKMPKIGPRCLVISPRSRQHWETDTHPGKHSPPPSRSLTPSTGPEIEQKHCARSPLHRRKPGIGKRPSQYLPLPSRPPTTSMMTGTGALP